MKRVVEILETKTDQWGTPLSVGWRTDMIGSARNCGVRFAELTERGQVARITDRRGNVLQ